MAPLATRNSTREAIRYRLPMRWTVSLLASVSIPLVLLFVTPVAPQNGWWWDILMGAGLLAAGLMISAPIVSPRVWIHYGGSARALRSLLYLHHDLAYAVVVLMLVHVIGLLLVDWTIIEYLKLSAPWSMLAALIAAVLSIVLVLSSLYRIELNIRYRHWRFWHIGLSTGATLLMAVHILDAGYFLNSPIKKAVFVGLLAGPGLVAFGAGGWHRLARADVYEPAHRRAGSQLRIPAGRGFSARIVMLLVILWITSIAIFAIPKGEVPVRERANSCVAATCDSA